ncbi:MAG: hypothetical protein IKS51_06030 [Erysipelotrichaceae bacterium]|nr:hypothetical protein [Erysipelotrichaceae bacterium]
MIDTRIKERFRKIDATGFYQRTLVSCWKKRYVPSLVILYDEKSDRFYAIRSYDLKRQRFQIKIIGIQDLLKNDRIVTGVFMLRRRKNRNISHFRHKKVDTSKYLKDYYVDNQLAYISCNVESYDDIIDHYSVPDYEDLNPDFVAFIEENAEHIPLEYPIVLEITGHVFNARQRQIITETISDYYNMKLGDTQLDIIDNNKRCLLLAVLSVIFWTMYFLLDVDHHYIFMIDFLSWYFVWFLAETILFDRQVIKDKKNSYGQLSSMKVLFRKEFVDDEVPLTVEQQIIDEILEDNVTDRM